MTKIYLAPLKGFTDCVYRTVYGKHFKGVDLAYAPFIATTKELKVSTARVRDIFPENNRVMKIIPQILSNDSLDFINLSNYITDLGYDEVNLNLGCPHKTVTSKRKGSALLREAYFLDTFFNDVFRKIKCKLSIKIRNGFSSHNDIFELVPIINRYPFESVTIHPRTADQKYGGNVNISVFKEAKEMIKHPVVYNGDIFTLSDYLKIKNQLEDLDSVMLGRGVLFNPFLPSEVKGDRQKENDLERIESFLVDISESYRSRLHGPSHYLDRMKGLWFFLSQSFEDGKKILKKIRKCRDTLAYEETVSDFFNSDPMWLPDSYVTDKNQG